MPQQKPYLGTSNARVTAAFNETSEKSYVYGTDFTFGTPVAFSGVGGRNTSVPVIPANGGSITYHQYSRLDLGVLAELTGTAAIPKVQLPSGSFSIHTVLTQINTALGLNLTTAEVVNTSYSQGAGVYRLTISNSVAWLPGSFYDFQAEVAA